MRLAERSKKHSVATRRNRSNSRRDELNTRRDEPEQRLDESKDQFSPGSDFIGFMTALRWLYGTVNLPFHAVSFITVIAMD